MIFSLKIVFIVFPELGSVIARPWKYRICAKASVTCRYDFDIIGSDRACGCHSHQRILQRVFPPILLNLFNINFDDGM